MSPKGPSDICSCAVKFQNLLEPECGKEAVFPSVQNGSQLVLIQKAMSAEKGVVLGLHWSLGSMLGVCSDPGCFN